MKRVKTTTLSMIVGEISIEDASDHIMTKILQEEEEEEEEEINPLCLSGSMEAIREMLRQVGVLVWCKWYITEITRTLRVFPSSRIGSFYL